jgi:hypothetical protein
MCKPVLYAFFMAFIVVYFALTSFSFKWSNNIPMSGTVAAVANT